MDIENLLDQFRRASPEEIESALEDVAIGVELMSYSKPLTDSERQGLKDDLMRIAIRRSMLEKELEKIKDDFKAKITPVKQKYAATIEALQTDTMWLEDDLFLVPDWKHHKVTYIDRHGNVINSRDMTKEEKAKNQTS